MNSLVIDAFEFCRRKEQREGQFIVADLIRLDADCADQSGEINWSLKGSTGHFGHEQLTLKVYGHVKLKCQRCMEAFIFNIECKSILALANNDEQADEVEELMDDDAVDVIVGSNAFSISLLVEDEVLLALPLSPKHDVCPDSAMADKLSIKQKNSPFSVLGSRNK